MLLYCHVKNQIYYNTSCTFWWEIGHEFCCKSYYFVNIIGNSKYPYYFRIPNLQTKFKAMPPPPSIHLLPNKNSILPISHNMYIGVVIVSDRALRFDGKIVTRRKIYVGTCSILTHKSFLEKIPPATNLQTCNWFVIFTG